VLGDVHFLPAVKERPQVPGFEEAGMLNAIAWALACFGVVAADIALGVVLFSVLDAVSVLTGYPIDNLDIQWFQAAAQTASFLMALLWWRYLWPRSFMARSQSEHPLGGGARGAWKRIACVIVIGLALQVVVSYVTDAVLSLLPDAAADYSELVEETGMGDTSPLAVLTTVLGAPFCEELLVRGVIFEFSLRAFNPQCRPLWKRRRRASAQDGAIVPWAAPSTWGVAAAIMLQAAIFGFMHMNWVQGCYAGAAALIFGWLLVTTGKLRYTILLHFAFNAGSYLMGLLWFVNTPVDVAITVAIAGVILVEAMRSLRHACGMDAASALLP
ncbi:MAG: CPBP family intramembrane metalloprotease, partial [Collinsella sp.]|nr:CPBP family intramembrane metalloprotease [Collinsella sp.]